MIQYIVTIVMGTVIGYGTNYLAVKMLFRPKHEVMFMGKRLPFTPGVIPKQKDKLAVAVGDVVGNKLLTKEDIKSRLSEEKLKGDITGIITGVLSEKLRDEVIKIWKMSDESYEEKKTKLASMTTALIVQSVNSMEIGKMVSNEAPKKFHEWVMAEDGFKRRLFNNALVEEVIKGFTESLGKIAQQWIEENGAAIIRREVDKKLDEAENESIKSLLDKGGFSEENLLATISDTYDDVVDKLVDELMQRVDIPKMIKEKIDQMDVDTLEQIVLKVMKEQLDMIVNLGALIGFALGLINVGINVIFS